MEPGGVPGEHIIIARVQAIARLTAVSLVKIKCDSLIYVVEVLAILRDQTGRFCNEVLLRCNSVGLCVFFLSSDCVESVRVAYLKFALR